MDEKTASEWPQARADLVERLAELLSAAPGVERRKMFGCPCAFLNGQMFAGVFGDRVFVRLPNEERAVVLALEGGGWFEPNGRRMREYVVLPPETVAGPAASEWVEKALTYAASLPPKT